MPIRTVRADEKGLKVNAYGWVVRPSGESRMRAGEHVNLSSQDDPILSDFGVITDARGTRERWVIKNSETSFKS